MCEYVGAKIPSKWKQFGRFVGVSEGDLDAIQVEEAQWLRECFTQVFNRWYTGVTSFYTWETVAQALESEAINERKLLNDLYKTLNQKK